MIKIENFEVVGWEAAIRSIRNSTNSWDESDTDWFYVSDENKEDATNYIERDSSEPHLYKLIGHNDLDLIMRLRNAGTDHHKFMRMIMVYVDITAPLYWWKEFDTYEICAAANGCSTMDNIMDKEFTVDDFSHEHLFGPDDMCPYDERRDLAEDKALAAIDVNGNVCYYTPIGYMKMTCDILNYYRNKYLEAKSDPTKKELTKKYWWQIVQLLPSSYNQKRTVILNYEVLANIYRNKKAYELDGWAAFCRWIETLPYSEIIIGGK